MKYSVFFTNPMAIWVARIVFVLIAVAFMHLLLNKVVETYSYIEKTIGLAFFAVLGFTAGYWLYQIPTTTFLGVVIETTITLVIACAVLYGLRPRTLILRYLLGATGYMWIVVIVLSIIKV